ESEHVGRGTAGGANRPGERDTVHLGHLVIEKGDVEGVALTDPSQGDGRGVRLSGAHAPSLRLELQEQAIAAVVVHDQDSLARQLRLRPVGGATFRSLDLVGDDREMERRALSRLALRPDPPAHELTQALADDQPQAGAAISAGRRGIDLAEDFEQTIEPVLRDFAAGVSDAAVVLVAVPLAPAGL